MPIGNSLEDAGWALVWDERNEVSTGSGSDRVSYDNNGELAGNLTRSLPLPVLTSSGGAAADSYRSLSTM